MKRISCILYVYIYHLDTCIYRSVVKNRIFKTMVIASNNLGWVYDLWLVRNRIIVPWPGESVYSCSKHAKTYNTHARTHAYTRAYVHETQRRVFADRVTVTPVRAPGPTTLTSFTIVDKSAAAAAVIKFYRSKSNKHRRCTLATVKWYTKYRLAIDTVVRTTNWIYINYVQSRVKRIKTKKKTTGPPPSR